MRTDQHKPLRHLGAMSLSIIMAIDRRLGVRGADSMWLPWENCYQSVSDIERPPVELYRSHDKGLANGVSNPFPMDSILA